MMLPLIQQQRMVWVTRQQDRFNDNFSTIRLLYYKSKFGKKKL